CGDGIDNNVVEQCDDANTAANDGCGPTCLVEFCGDTLVNGIEECDDGNTAADDGCGPTCLVEFCGDTVVNGSEECDDGNTAADDGCGPTCLVEFCGDTLVNGTEQCDDGNAVADDGCGPTCLIEYCGEGIDNNVVEQCDDGNIAANDGCGPTCLVEFCGDTLVNGIEECDDGNTAADDGCGPTCLLEFCGDTVVSGTEQCDDGNTLADDGCGPTCLLESCGDTVVNGTEQCDDGNTLPDDGCGPTCLLEFCGDTVVNGTEQCDDGNTMPDDGCGPTCLLESCGDSVVNGTEECDDGNTARDDGCGATCVLEFCGDGLVNNLGEECDDTNTDPGDGCDSNCAVEAGWECVGEPSVCTEINPNIDQLFRGTWPDIDVSSQYILFVSPEDLHNDQRVDVNNADGNEEVFVLDLNARKKHGPGVCLGGSKSGSSCGSYRDCPSSGPVKLKPCGRLLQLTDTVAGGAPYSQTVVSNHGRLTAYADASSGVGTVPTWNRKAFETTSLPAAIDDIGEGTVPAIDTGGKVVAVESTANHTGENADGNSEIFIHDMRTGQWRQVTHTQAPVQNHRPRSAYNRRFVFDSNGDISNVSRRNIKNPDLNREIYLVRFDLEKTRIMQLTDTTGADLVTGCAARSGSWVYFSSNGNLHNDVGPAVSNADGNVELFRWRQGGEFNGRIKQLTDSPSGENVNADCSPRGRLVVFESTSDLDNDGSSNRRVYVQNAGSGRRRLLSPSPDGDSVRPRVSRKKVVFASTSNLTESNPAGESVIYLYDLSVGADELIAP
ncbi:MAG: DUF4215 domain-containing protein, partial [Deltaproteobacteria bacterium]|nr:DUF4215 domain-containing protein [Deltaproteobacteria bacterium]